MQKYRFVEVPKKFIPFLEQLGPDGIHISMGTVLPETAKKIAAMHAQHGSAYVEAPIFGRPEAVADKRLWIPYTGSRQAKERVQPILKAMGGQGLFDFREEVGAATIVKLVGNFLIVFLHDLLSTDLK
ncbi:NAD(P)-binding domain-containing protein [Salibacterium sp. K-3]